MKLNTGNIEEILYAHRLADVEVATRSKALKKLRKFLNYKSSIESFTLDDLLKLWKGLYYCMYMADKPLVQENLSEDIGSLIHEIRNSGQKLLFFEAALKTFVREWNGIDKFRIDKFMMLFTRFLRQSFVYLCQNGWNLEEVSKFVLLLETVILCPLDNTNSTPLGLKMHLTDIILEELAKIGKEDLSNDVIILFLYPFFKVLVVSRIHRFVKYVQDRIFRALIRQSDLGIQHQDDLALGEMEITDDKTDHVESENEEEEALDPRAGGVNVFIPQLKPKYAQIADIFMALGGMSEINQKKRNTFYAHCNEFLDLEMGTYPFKDPEVKFEEDCDISRKEVVKRGFNNITDFEKNLTSESQELQSSNSKKLKLGDYGLSIKKSRKEWKRLPKKSKEDRRKEVAKGMMNPEFAMNKVMLQLCEKIKLPKYILSIKPKKSKIAKKTKCDKVESMLNSKNENLMVQNTKLNNKNKTKHNDKVKPISESKNENLLVISSNFITNDKKMQTKSSPELPLDKEKSMKQPSVTKIKKRKIQTEENLKVKKKKILQNANKLVTKDKTKVESSKVKKEVNLFNDDWKEEEISNKGNNIKKFVNNNKESSIKDKNGADKLSNGDLRHTLNIIGKPNKKDSLKSDNKKGNVKLIEDFKRKNPPSPKMEMVINTPKTNAKGKVFKINLRQNTEHDLVHYKTILSESPGIPYHAHKKPKASVLKPSPSPNLIRKPNKKLKRLMKYSPQ